MIVYLDDVIDNLTEALLFLAHYVGDIHQVSQSFFILLSLTCPDYDRSDSANYCK